MEIVVLDSLWPSHRYVELGGVGWAATVVSFTASTAVVHFTEATARDGRPYHDERLPLSCLRVIA